MKSIIKILKEHNVSFNTFLRLYILFSISMGILLFCLFGCFLAILRNHGLISLVCIVAITIFLVLLEKLSKNDNGISSIANKILLIIYRVFSYSFDFTYPGFIILASFMFVLLFAFSIPFVPISLLRILNVINISDVSILFISLALGSILCVYCPKIFYWMIINHSPLKDWGEHEYQKYQINLAIYVINGKNINLLVNLAYLVYLFISGYCMVQYQTPLISYSVDYAILKAFLVFMAFSGTVRAYKDKDVSSKKLGVKMLGIVLSRYHYYFEDNIETESTDNQVKDAPKIKNNASDTMQERQN